MLNQFKNNNLTKSRCDHDFKIEEQVFLIAEHIKQLNSVVYKLQPRAHGPFKIIEAVDKNVFKLEYHQQ